MNIKKIGAWILASFLILSFAIWGIGDIFRGQAPTETIAEVGGTDITGDELSNRVARLLNAMRNRFGGDFDAEQARRLGLIDQTVEQMVSSRAVGLEGHRLGLTAGEGLIRETIFADPSFRGPGGQFNRLAFEQRLSQLGMSEATYVSTLRQEIVQDQLTSTVAAADVVPGILFDTLYRYRNEKRVASVVQIPAGKLTDIPDPSLATLKEYHQKNPARFTAPEYRALTVVYLNPDQAAKELNPTEERINEEFEYRKESKAIPERRDLEQVLLQDETKAKEIAQAARTGRPLADAAKEIAETTVAGLGKLTRRDLPDPLAKAAFALDKGGVSDPVKSALGWHVIRVREIQPGKVPTLEALRPEIVRDLAREMAIDNFVKQIGRFDDVLAGGATLEDGAAEIGAQPIKVAAIDADARGRDGKPVPDVPRSPRFLELAFETPKGEVTNVEEAENGGFFVLRVDGISPPELRPFDTVRTSVTEAWKQAQLQESARKKAANLLEAAKSSGSLAKAIDGTDYKIVDSKPFTRFIRDAGSNVSSALSAKLFGAKQGEIVMAPDDKGYSVAELQKIIAAQPGENKQESDALRDELRSSRAQDNVQQFVDALRKRYSVKVDQSAVERVITGRFGG